MLRDPILKLDTKPIQRGLPVSNRHIPFLADVSQRQVEQLAQRLVAGKRAPVLGNLAQTHVHRFDGIGGNPPARPKAPEVEFSTKEFLREEVKIYRQPDHGCAQTG